MSNVTEVSQVKLADAFNYFMFEGYYVLVGFVTKMDANRSPFWLITIADASSTLTVYSKDQEVISNCLKPQSLIKIKVQLLNSGNLIFYKCDSIIPATASHNQFKSLCQLPKSLCPAPQKLELMLELVQCITQPCLRSFVLNVLSIPEIGIAYIQCPGSINHHHNYPGGLLEHSVEVAYYFQNNCNISNEDRALGIVGGLLHDIGKTQCYTPDMNYTAKGYLVSHDSLTLEICASALTTLSQENAGFANQLRHAWTCSTPNSRYGFKPKTRLARKLQDYDRASAAIGLRVKARVRARSIIDEEVSSELLLA